MHARHRAARRNEAKRVLRWPEVAIARKGQNMRLHYGPVPSKDGRQPKYRWVLLSADRTDWLASTDNEQEGLPAFARLVELGEASEIVEVRQ